MSDRVAAAAKVIDTEHVKSMRNMRLPNPRKLARALDAAGLLAPEMQEEWAVERHLIYQGGEWAQLGPWMDTPNKARMYIANQLPGNALPTRLVRRYVTAAEDMEETDE